MADSLRELVQELGDLSVDAIADKLCGMNIKGVRSQDSQCAIARYLSKSLDKRVRVNGPNIRVFDSQYISGVDTPPSVKLFIDSFDGGEYPELEEYHGRLSTIYTE